MIDQKIHAKLEKKWAKAGPGVYQRWGRIETRMPLFLKYVNRLKGLNVIEFGCNAGIYGYEISKVAKSYVGVDQGDYYIKQANITKDFLEMGNATFHNRRVKGFIRDCQKHPEEAPEINGIFASFVLYHLKDRETDLIKEYLLPKCKVVLILTRTSKRSPWKKYNSLKLNKIKNVEKYLSSAGFVCESEMHPSGKFGITLATRTENVDDKGNGDGDKKSSDETTRRRRTSSVKQGRIPKGRKVLHAKRKADAEGTDSVLPPVQEEVGSEGILQGGQRGELSSEPEGGNEGVEKPAETGPIQSDSKITESSKGGFGSDLSEG